MIEAIDLTVRRHGRIVLDAVSFDVRPGQVTGVLGGTGSGKTTLLRRMVQLERGGGETLFDGRPYRSLLHPMREVGLLLEPGVGHPDRTVRDQLRLVLATDRRAARDGDMTSTTDRHSAWEGGTTGASRRSAWEGGMARATGRRAARDGGTVRPTDRRLAREGDTAGATDWRAAWEGGAAGATDRRLVPEGGTASPTNRHSAWDGGAAGAMDRSVGWDGDTTGARDRSAVWEGGAAGATERRWARDGGAVGAADRRLVGLPADSIAESWLSPPEQRVRPGQRRGLGDRLAASRRGSPADRIDAVLDIVGLADQHDTRLADLTDGMATRLGIAVALLGDPKALLFDSPERGLEPEGVAWLGALLRAFTGQGRAALVTGSDTETLVGLADRILLLDSGYLVGTRTAEEVLRAPTGAAVIVRSPQIVRFAAILAEAGARSAQGEGACLEVRGLDRARVGDLAYRHSVPVHELSERFTGSDPADVVLAACSGRNRPVVPLQGFPENVSDVDVVGSTFAGSGNATATLPSASECPDEDEQQSPTRSPLEVDVLSSAEDEFRVAAAGSPSSNSATSTRAPAQAPTQMSRSAELKLRSEEPTSRSAEPTSRSAGPMSRSAGPAHVGEPVQPAEPGEVPAGLPAELGVDTAMDGAAEANR